MKTINLEFAQTYFDFLVEEVEKGETFIIDCEKYKIAMLPYKEYEKIQKEIEQIKNLTLRKQ